MMARMMSLPGTPSGNKPSTTARIFLAFFWISVCVASTCSTSEAPMPCASAPNAPWVEGWLRPRAERAMGRGMAVAADDGGARQREALLGTNYVHDALAPIELVVIFDAEFFCVFRQHPHLLDAFRVRIGLGTVGGGNVVIDHGQRFLRCMHLASR